MAISKERLSEIVREKKTFWWCQPYADSFIVREIRQPRVEVVVKDKYCVLIENEKEYLAEFEHLTEDKEDAEELAEFGNIIRMEKLELPMWEEIKHDFIDNKQSGGNYCVKEFLGKDQEYSLDIVVYNGEVMVLVSDEDFYEPLTKENYDNARRLCVKLFRGESV